MYKLCLNSRDVLLIIELDKVAYFQANGNYTQLTYISGECHLLSMGLSKLEEYIRKALPKDAVSPFVRLGRSFIINQSLLFSINVLKQKLILSDNEGHTYTLSVPKPILKEYKQKINGLYLK